MFNLIMKMISEFYNSLQVQEPRVIKKNIFDVFDALLKNNSAPKKQVNIIGFRNESKPDSWNDLIVYNIGNKIIVCTATTDPGTFYTTNPLDPAGCAHLPEGYYEDIWKLGLHRGEYEALIHDGKRIKVWRDKNKNFLDDDGVITEKTSAINNHHGKCNRKTSKDSKTVGFQSAGCQVVKWEDVFQEIIEEIKNCNQRSFSYLLLLMEDCPVEILKAAKDTWLYKENY